MWGPHENFKSNFVGLKKAQPLSDGKPADSNGRLKRLNWRAKAVKLFAVPVFGGVEAAELNSKPSM